MTFLEELESYSRSDITYLVSQGPDFVLEFVTKAFSGLVSTDELIKHQIFLYSIASTARFYTFVLDEESESVSVDLKWARVADLTFQHLVNLREDSFGTQISWMQFKIGLLNNLGEKRDSSLGTYEQVTSWFFANLSISFEEMQHLLALDPNEMDPKEHHKMLLIRSRVKLVSRLRENDQFRRPRELNDWLELFNIDEDNDHQ